MSANSEIETRIEKALARIEAAAGKSAVGGADAKVLRDRVASLLAERDRLAEALIAEREESAKLKALVATVSGRLDSTIERVRGALGR